MPKEINRKKIILKKDGDKYQIVLVMLGYEFHSADKHSCVSDKILLGCIRKKHIRLFLQAFGYGDIDTIEVSSK